MSKIGEIFDELWILFVYDLGVFGESCICNCGPSHFKDGDLNYSHVNDTEMLYPSLVKVAI